VARDFSDKLRAFYGICIASDILMDWDFSPSAATPIVVNRSDSDEFMLVQLTNQESDLQRCAACETTLSVDDRVKLNNESIENILEPAIAMFQADDPVKLETAATWLLRAHLSTSGMDKILESTIAMEVLLGDRDTSDRVGLSKLMANRCAYSLGRTAVERKEIIDFFSTFYRVRSEIVHSGRFKISSTEAEVVTKGLNLASRILRHEIRLGGGGINRNSKGKRKAENS
jgi:hypothetical protein